MQAVDGAPVNITISNETGRLLSLRGISTSYAVALSPADSLERRIWKTACLRFPSLGTCEGGPRTVSNTRAT
jgi:hypothetical protein